MGDPNPKHGSRSRFVHSLADYGWCSALPWDEWTILASRRDNCQYIDQANTARIYNHYKEPKYESQICITDNVSYIVLGPYAVFHECWSDPWWIRIQISVFDGQKMKNLQKQIFWIITFLLRSHKKPQLFKTSVADPWHFGVDPDPYLDPRIHASDQWIRIRILLFSSLTFPRCQQKTNLKKSFYADYFLKALVHHFQR